MSNNNVPGSNQNVNVQVRTLTTDPNVTSQYKTKILHKNVVNGVNTLTQAMMNDTNTKYVIKYDYVLGEDISIPANCVLEFEGGSISGGTISGNNIVIYGKSVWENLYMNFEGNVIVKDVFLNYTNHLTKSCMVITDSTNVDIQNIKIETLANLYPYTDAPVGCGGIIITDSSNIYINNCYIKNTEEHNTNEDGAYFHSPITIYNSNNIIIENCHIVDSPTEYIALWDSCTNAVVKNCICENIRGGNNTFGNSAVATGGADGDIVVDSVVIKNVGASGLSLNSKKIIVTNCRVENNKESHGITLGHNVDDGRVQTAIVSNCILINNSATSTQYGIYNEATTEDSILIVTNCRIEGYYSAVDTTARETKIINVSCKFNNFVNTVFCRNNLRTADTTNIKIDNCKVNDCGFILSCPVKANFGYNVTITNSTFKSRIPLILTSDTKYVSDKENIIIIKNNYIKSTASHILSFYDMSMTKIILENNIIEIPNYLINQGSPSGNVVTFDSSYILNNNIIKSTLDSGTRLLYFDYPSGKGTPYLFFKNNVLNRDSSGNALSNMETNLSDNSKTVS